MTAFTKKPVTIEAVQVTALDFSSFGFDNMPFAETPDWIRAAYEAGTIAAVGRDDQSHVVLSVQTNHGYAQAAPGDWVIKQVDGELYPCKDSVFQATYSPAGEGVSGLPVSGYRPQNEENIRLANLNKEAEEQVLRILDGLAGRPEVDKRWLAIGRTAIENGFMAVNRAVFQPGRVTLPGDVPALASETVVDTAFQDLRSRGEPRVPRRDEPLPNGRPHP